MSNMTNEDLARAAALSILKVMAIKWTIIIVTTKLARRAVRKMEQAG